MQSASRVSKGSPTSSSAPSYSGRRFLPTAPPFLSSDSSVPECPLHGLEPSTQDRPVTAIPGYILDLSRRLGSSFRPTKLFLAFCRTEGRFLTLFLRELKPRRILPGPTSPIPADGVLGACASLGRSGGVIGVRLASRLKTVRKSVCVCVCYVLLVREDGFLLCLPEHFVPNFLLGALAPTLWTWGPTGPAKPQMRPFFWTHLRAAQPFSGLWTWKLSIYWSTKTRRASGALTLARQWIPAVSEGLASGFPTAVSDLAAPPAGPPASRPKGKAPYGDPDRPP